MTSSADRELHVVLLCGGHNTRLDVLSGTLYKPFLPVRGLSLVARHVMRVSLAGATAITIVVDELDPLVCRYVESMQTEIGSICSVGLTAVEGTTAAKIRAFHSSHPDATRTIVVLGDTYAQYDPRTLADESRRPGIDSAMTVGTFRLPFGVVDCNEGIVSSFEEKPKTPYQVNLGQLALGPIALRLLADGLEVDATLAELARRRCLAGVELGSSFLTLDAIADIAAAFTSHALDESFVNGEPTTMMIRGENEQLERVN